MNTKDGIKFCSTNILGGWAQSITEIIITYLRFNPLISSILFALYPLVTRGETMYGVPLNWIPPIWPRGLESEGLPRAIKEISRTQKNNDLSTNTNKTPPPNLLFSEVQATTIKPLNDEDFLNLICNSISPAIDFFARHGVVIKNMTHIEGLSLLYSAGDVIKKFHSPFLEDILSSTYQNCIKRILSREEISMICNSMQELCAELQMHGMSFASCNS